MVTSLSGLTPLVCLLASLVTHQVTSLPLKQRLERVRTSGNDAWFRDASGRVRILHGVNIVSKQFPWYRDYVYNDSRLDDLRDWGFNVVRLGSMWSGAEPVRGKYNMTYIKVLKDTVKRLAERGIYTMLDMHQDCLTSKYEAYDGVPRWLVDEYPEPTNPFPWPLTSIGAWEEKYVTQAVSEAFQHFYNNVADSITLWAAFWEKMAETFTGDPAVLGYNLMNEPWIGDFYKDINLVLPAVAGRKNLLPSYDVINEKIRRHDKEGIVFYEPVFYGQANHGPLLGSGFERLPGGSTYTNVSAYSFHMYCWALEFMPPDATDEQRTQARDFCYETFLPQIMASARSNVQLTGGGHILTEFGLCKTGQNKQINVECQFFLDLADKNLMSWIEWDYNDNAWYREGVPVWDKVTPHIRTYARAIAGIPTKMSFNEETGEFTLEYNPDAKISKATEIFVPRLRYPSGFSIKVSEGLKYETKGQDQVYVYHDRNASWTSKMATVNISPA